VATFFFPGCFGWRRIPLSRLIRGPSLFQIPTDKPEKNQSDEYDAADADAVQNKIVIHGLGFISRVRSFDKQLTIA
jgi:hypothetical protein